MRVDSSQTGHGYLYPTGRDRVKQPPNGSIKHHQPSIHLFKAASIFKGPKGVKSNYERSSGQSELKLTTGFRH